MARLNRDAVQLVAEALHEGCADGRTSWVQAWRATRVLLSVCTDWWAGVEAHLKCHLQQLAGCALRPRHGRSCRTPSPFSTAWTCARCSTRRSDPSTRRSQWPARSRRTFRATRACAAGHKARLRVVVSGEGRQHGPTVPRATQPAGGDEVAPVAAALAALRALGHASETGFSPSRDIGTRRRCLPLTAERPKRHGHARHAHRSTLCRVVAGYHPPHSSLSVPPVCDAMANARRHFLLALVAAPLGKAHGLDPCSNGKLIGALRRAGGGGHRGLHSPDTFSLRGPSQIPKPGMGYRPVTLKGGHTRH
jgi:hypothetical protein